ncbi:MAG: hypothetical protein R2692_05785 [Microbacterium sp.]
MPTRLHAATKPRCSELIICVAIALALRSWPVVTCSCRSC